MIGGFNPYGSEGPSSPMCFGIADDNGTPHDIECVYACQWDIAAESAAARRSYYDFGWDTVNFNIFSGLDADDIASEDEGSDFCSVVSTLRPSDAGSDFALLPLP